MPITIPPFEYAPVKTTWLKRDVLLFAHSIGCKAGDELHFLYVRIAMKLPRSILELEKRISPSLVANFCSQELHPKFQVFPTYPIVLSTGIFLFLCTCLQKY